MAISANTVWEVRTTGSDSNGGGFVTGAAGTDYSQQDGSQYAFADLASSNGTNGTPSVTSASHSFAAADVGNIIRITAGSNWTTGFFQIVSVSAGAAVLDKACGSSASLTSGTYVVGGAFISPGQAGAAATITGNLVYVKSGTYTITSASTNVSGGCISATSGTTFTGYNSTRTRASTDTRPTLVLNAALSSATIATGTCLYSNIIFDGASQTTSRGINTSVSYRCKFQNFTNAGMNGGACVYAEFTGCTTQNACFATAAWSVAYSNSVVSFTGTCINCIGFSNTAVVFSMNASTAVNCIAYGNTGATTDGFQHGGTSAAFYINCIAENNGRYGFNPSNAADCILINCAHFNNGTAGVNSAQTMQEINTLALSASPFVAAATQDFRLNSTASAGASCRAAGYPSTWPAVSASMLSYDDIGAAQSRATGGDMNGGLDG